MEHNIINCVCVDFGNTYTDKSQTIKFKTCDFYYLCYITAGKGKITIDSLNLSLNEGQSVFVFPFSTVCLQSDVDSELSYKWIKFRGIEVDWIMSMIDVDKKRPVVDKIPIENFDTFFNLQPIGDEHFLKCRLNSSIFLLLSYYMEFYPRIQEISNDYAHMAKEYIEQNYRSSKCTVQNVAKYVKIDRTYLYKLFKQETGMNIIEYINQCRVAKAAEMLTECKLSIKIIANFVGFTDQLYFSKVFKKIYGISPTNYRKIYAKDKKHNINKNDSA